MWESIFLRSATAGQYFFTSQLQNKKCQAKEPEGWLLQFLGRDGGTTITYLRL